MALWYQAGINPDKSWVYNRSIILCNWVSVILSGVTFAIGCITWMRFGWIISTWLAFVTSSILLVPLELNRQSRINLSRVWISLFLTLCLLSISVIDKLDRTSPLEEFHYYQYRVTMLGVSIIPILLFRLSEKKYWVPLIFFNFLCLLLYDIIHIAFGVGYYEMGFSGTDYYFINNIFILSFLLLVAGTYFLKAGYERFELKNERLIKTLFDTNEKLEKKNMEIERRERELEKVNEVIGVQRKLLEQENAKLNQELVTKNFQLTQSNRELIRHNNELTQFSYTVSHNLRGPVASLIGLLNLLDRKIPPAKQGEIIDHISQSVFSLDSIIRDLSSIIDYRHAVSQFKRKVVLEEEVDKILDVLKKTIDDANAVVDTDFGAAPDILTVRAMINSILYNLISNAIKYRSPERRPHLRISSGLEDGFLRIDVSDNGLGLDIEKFSQKLFGLYKRFHTHAEGKGLGLFLVKLQAEALEGRVQVKSTLGVGTTFSVFIKIPDPRNDQILVETEFARIRYDAACDAVVSEWSGSMTEANCDELISSVVDLVTLHKVPNWIVDLSVIKNKDELAFFSDKLESKLKSVAFLRMAMVIDRIFVTELGGKDFYSQSGQERMELAFCSSFDQAVQWISRQSAQSRESKPPTIVQQN